MAEEQNITSCKIMVAIQKNKLEEMILKYFQKNGKPLILKKHFPFFGYMLKEAQGARREGMVSISEESGKSILSMAPFFKNHLIDMLKDNGLVFKTLTA